MSPATCLAGVAMIVHGRNPSLSNAWTRAIAHDVCVVSAQNSLNPAFLTATMLTENARCEPLLVRRATYGYDVGLFQVNTWFQRSRPGIAAAIDPYNGARIAAAVMRRNFRKYRGSWQAIAAYWSPAQAEANTPMAIRYYWRWRHNYSISMGTFQIARLRINETMGDR